MTCSAPAWYENSAYAAWTAAAVALLYTVATIALLWSTIRYNRRQLALLARRSSLELVQPTLTDRHCIEAPIANQTVVNDQVYISATIKSFQFRLPIRASDTNPTDI